jgi:hypothetical protein
VKRRRGERHVGHGLGAQEADDGLRVGLVQPGEGEVRAKATRLCLETQRTGRRFDLLV